MNSHTKMGLRFEHVFTERGCEDFAVLFLEIKHFYFIF